MKNSFIICIVITFTPYNLQAQNELEVIKISYMRCQNSAINNERFKVLNDVSVNTRIIDFFTHYGHYIGKKKLELSYQLEYQNFSQTTNAKSVLGNSTLSSIQKEYYETPPFSKLSLTSGVQKLFKNNWSGSTSITVNYTDDVCNNKLRSNLSWGSITYLEKQGSNKFSYGFGVFLNQVESRLLLTPVLGLKIQSNKRGVELLFPEKLRIWQKLNNTSYLEAFANYNSFSIRYTEKKELISTEIFYIESGISYHYKWKNVLKLSLGGNIPIVFYSSHSKIELTHYTLSNSIGINTSISLIIPNG